MLNTLLENCSYKITIMFYCYIFALFNYLSHCRPAKITCLSPFRSPVWRLFAIMRRKCAMTQISHHYILSTRHSKKGGKWTLCTACFFPDPRQMDTDLSWFAIWCHLNLWLFISIPDVVFGKELFILTNCITTNSCILSSVYKPCFVKDQGCVTINEWPPDYWEKRQKPTFGFVKKCNFHTEISTQTVLIK